MTRFVPNRERRCVHWNANNSQRFASYDSVRVVAMVLADGVQAHFVLDDLTGAAGIAPSILRAVMRTRNSLILWFLASSTVVEDRRRGRCLDSMQAICQSLVFLGVLTSCSCRFGS